jgi:hypothetical protein
LTPCGLPESRSSLSANGSHETHFNIQRRLYDYQFSLARTPVELEQRHQAFIQAYNTTAHQGLLKDQRFPAIPVEVLLTRTRSSKTYGLKSPIDPDFVR